jgi:ATP-binding cassette subfamily F protein 3
VLDIAQLRKSYGGQEVLGGVSLKVSPGDRLALVGPNGSGKTTILRLVTGAETADGGEIHRRRGLEIGYLPQEIEVSSHLALLAYVEDVADDVRRAESEIRDLESCMARGEATPGLLERYGHLQTRFEHLGGYALQARAERILSGLGFDGGDFDRALTAFSGGWRMRAALARILLREPDLVLLDEPTNHLDIVSLEWLEAHIRESDNAYLIVSHDVEFLDRVVTGVLALERGKAIRTRGGYRQYQIERRLREEQARTAYESYQRRQTAALAFADRFRYKASKARQVQSRLGQMRKEEPPPPPPPREEVPALRLPQPPRSGRSVVRLEAVVAGYADATIYRGLDLRIERGEKIALIGPNGAGKSTLLKLLAGVLRPISGQLTYGHGVTVSYFAQHQLEQLEPSRSVLEEMMSQPGLRSELEVRTILGAFLFSGETVDKKVAILSGGEKSRLVLAKMLATPGNFLLLDEPTNHLDIRACDVLKRTLDAYQGALCLITHDRDLINRVATRVVYVQGGRLREYLGNYDDFDRKRALEAGHIGDRGRPDKAGSGDGGRLGKRELRRQEAERRERLRRATAPLRERVARMEADIALAEGELAEVELALAQPSAYADPVRSAALAKRRAELVPRVDELTAKWEDAATELEEKEREGGPGYTG